MTPVAGFGLEDAWLDAVDGEDEQTLAAVVDLAAALSGMRYVAVVLVDAAGETVLLHCSAPSTAVGVDEVIDQLFPALLLADGMAVCADVRRQVSPGRAPVLDERGEEVRSLLSAPLDIGGVRVGRILAWDADVREICARQVNALRGAADLVAAVLRCRRDQRLTERMAVELHRTSADLAAAEAFTRALLEALPVGVAACDAEGRFTISNQTTRRWMDPQLGRAGDHPPAMVDLQDTWGTASTVHAPGTGLPVEGADSPLATALREGSVDGVELVIHHPEEASRTVWCSGRSFHDSWGGRLGAVVVMTDVTETRRLERDLRQATAHDPLTGLPNRRAFERLLSQACDATEGDPGPVSLLYCDLDGFKAVNDALGHDVGDDVLQITAGRMASAVGPGGVVARLGGDEFVVLLTGASASEPRCTEVAERIRAAVATPMTLADGRSTTIGVSVGHATRGDGEQPDSVVRAADRAMYAVKCGVR